MKASLRIFLNDMKNIGTNWVAAVLIGGLTLLPSLYAWFNIEASWDPYSQTDQIPVGIVNEDVGTVVRDKEIQVGEQLVDTLKDNHSMDWQFVDRKEAMEKLNYGDYFAVIVIPKNFSEKLGTVISGHPEKATVEYYVNEKVNAIAPKITEKGASVIVEQITSNFISTVNGLIFDEFNKIGIELEENLPDIEKFEDYIFTLEERLPEIHDILNDTISDADRAEQLIGKAEDLIPRVQDVTTNGLQTIDNTTLFLEDAENRLDEISPKVKERLTRIQTMVTETNDFVSEIDTTTINITDGNQITGPLSQQLEDTLTSVNTIEEALNQLQQQGDIVQAPITEGEESQVGPDQQNNQEAITNALTEIETIQQNLLKTQEQVNQLNSQLAGKQDEVNQVLSNLKDRTEKANEDVNAFVKEYNESIEPRVREEVANAKETLSKARSILVEIQTTLPEVQAMLNRTEANLAEGKDVLNYVSGEFPYVNTKVNELADRLRDFQGKTDINEMIDLLQNNPEAERSFFAEPVVLNQNKVFSIPNYGTGMTPFYTVLAIWVGGLLLISLLSTDIHHKKNFTGRQVYFGKSLTFISIGFFQTLIVTLGNLFLLKVPIAEPFFFVLFGLLCSLVFILIVYTLVSVFGDVGKALAIVILVLQIAGSGGTYPVVLLPKFFQMINPFLPFTYAIDLMREAVGGIVWKRVFHDVTFIILFGAIAIIIGGFLKEIINKYTDKLKEKSKKSGLFH